MGGFVAYTNLQSNVNREETNKINADSSVVTKYYTVENTMTIRVPNTMLDSTLKAITPYVDYLDFRVIKADDVSLQMAANKMSRKRSEANSKRLATAIDNKGKRLKDITNAEDLLAAKNEQADNSTLENLTLSDRVSFSTINIAMYEREAVKRELIANDDSGKYVQGLGSRLMDSLETGWRMIAGILVFITQLWALILIGLLTFYFYRRYKQQSAKV